uniref:Cholinergic receptor, nicotinic, alpha 11 n=1 Tax=Lepisosteus oculatus TaxID=7918 RepID=W5MIJ9_LEPOC
MLTSLLLHLASAAALIRVSEQGPHQRTLLKELLKDYNRMERPVGNDSLPLTVHFTLSLMQIMDVVCLPDCSCRPSYILTLRLLRHPRTPFLQRGTTFPHTTLLITLVPTFSDRHPFTQLVPPFCWETPLFIKSPHFSLDLLLLRVPPFFGGDPTACVVCVGVPGNRNEIFYDCCKEPYPDVTFVVTIRRRTLYYALNLLIPCVLLSSMTLLVFVLPADSGEKISLGITVLLSLTVFMLLVAEIMPATSDSIPLIGQYFASTMIIVGMSVVATVVVLQYHHHDPSGGRMPKWVELILFQWVAWFLRMKRPGEEGLPERPPCTPNLRRCSSGSGTGSLHCSPNPDPILHPLHPQNLPSLSPHAQLHAQLHGLHPSHGSTHNGNLLYLGFQNLDDPPVITAPQRPPRKGGPGSSGSPPPHVPPQFGSPLPHLQAMGVPSLNGESVGGGSTLSAGCGGAPGGGCLGVCPAGIGDPQLQAILEEVRFIADRFREQDEGETECEQWKFAAAVIDRLCLVAFSIFNIVCTISILMSAPNFVEAVSKDFI